jgi:deazaflavin-dependent oxidoreductase (nitroreductase family)
MGTNSGPAFVPQLHRWLYERTAGRLGHGIIGVPTLLLHTTGHRTGLRRTSALVYGRDGRSLVVVASNYGGAHEPAWLTNVRADPHVQLQIARRQLAAEARIVDQGDADYARLMALMNRINHNRYAHHQAGTTRPIPLVVMRLAEDGEPGARAG